MCKMKTYENCNFLKPLTNNNAQLPTSAIMNAGSVGFECL